VILQCCRNIGKALVFALVEMFRSYTYTTTSRLPLLTIFAPSVTTSPITNFSAAKAETMGLAFPISSMMGKRPLAEILYQALRTARWRG
jgi:hypothetical protein